MEMTEYLISLNPVQLEELSVLEATELTLTIMNEVIRHFKSLFDNQTKECQLLHKFNTTMEWYFRSIARIIARDGEELNPVLELGNINITTITKETNECAETNVDILSDDIKKVPTDKLLEIITLMLIGNYYYIRDNTPKKQTSRSDNLFNLVVTNLSQLQGLMSGKSANNKTVEANFYKVNVKVQTKLLKHILDKL